MDVVVFDCLGGQPHYSIRLRAVIRGFADLQSHHPCKVVVIPGCFVSSAMAFFSLCDHYHRRCTGVMISMGPIDTPFAILVITLISIPTTYFQIQAFRFKLGLGHILSRMKGDG